MCWHTVFDLAVSPEATRIARAHLRTRLRPHITKPAREVVDDVQLVATELITNAVQAHARRVRVSVELHRDELIIRVADDGLGWPMMRHAQATDRNGRGLAIVTALSEQWGVDAVDAVTKQVWVSMPLRPGSVDLLSCGR